QKMGFSVSENQAEQEESEDTVFQSGQRAKVRVAGQEERARKQLNHKISRRDASFAVAAVATQNQPAQDGNVVVETNGLLARGAGRAGADHRQVKRQPVDTHVEEAA